MFEIECLFGRLYCWCLIPTLGLSSSFSLSSHSQPFFLRGPHSCSTMMPVSPSWPGLQSHVSHLSDTCHVSPHLLPLPLTTPMHFFHLKQERPQLLGRLASGVRARPSRRRQPDTEDRRMVAGEVCNTTRPRYRIYRANVQTVVWRTAVKTLLEDVSWLKASCIFVTISFVPAEVGGAVQWRPPAGCWVKV